MSPNMSTRGMRAHFSCKQPPCFLWIFPFFPYSLIYLSSCSLPKTFQYAPSRCEIFYNFRCASFGALPVALGPAFSLSLSPFPLVVPRLSTIPKRPLPLGLCQTPEKKMSFPLILGSPFIQPQRLHAKREDVGSCRSCRMRMMGICPAKRPGVQ